MISEFFQFRRKIRLLKAENKILKDQIDRCVEVIEKQRDVLQEYQNYAKEADELIHNSLLNKNEDVPEALQECWILKYDKIIQGEIYVIQSIKKESQEEHQQSHG